MRSLYATVLAVLLGAGPAPLAAQELDSVDKAFLQAVLTEPGRAQAELAVFAAKNPLLTAYFVGLSVQDRCAIPAPSQALHEAAGVDGAMKTRDGKWTFIVGVAAGSMTFPTKADEDGFCKSARALVSRAEEAARQPR